MNPIEQYGNEIDKIAQAITKSHNTVIISHANADGDAMGSLLGMYHLLHGEASIILPNGCSKNFSWMPGAEKILSGDHQPERCKQLLSDAQLIIGVDFNNASRVDILADALTQSSAEKVLIDHHLNPDHELFDTVVSTPLSSACEMVYWVARTIWGDDAINTDAARCLYTGICTDTGSFSYSCEDPSLYEASAALVAKGIDAAGIHNNIINIFSINRIRFYGFALSELMKIYPSQRFAGIYISLKDQKRFGIEPADMEGLVNYTLMMKEIEVGVLVREEPNRVKISFRSKNDVDVNQIARTYFDGGGHVKAAGATSKLSFAETIAKVEKIFKVENFTDTAKKTI